MTVTTIGIASLPTKFTLPNKTDRLLFEIFKEVAIHVVALFCKFPTASDVLLFVVVRVTVGRTKQGTKLRE